MKEWNFKVKSNPNEISRKLESSLGSINGFVLDINHEENSSVTFKMRKRILYAWYMVFQNWTTVKGKLFKSNSENKTDVEISFNQHFLIKLVVFTHILLGFGLLMAVATGINNSGMYIISGILLVVGVVLWIGVQMKFQKDIEKYKTLISGILEP